jgi:hypothetical protein
VRKSGNKIKKICIARGCEIQPELRCDCERMDPRAYTKAVEDIFQVTNRISYRGLVCDIELSGAGVSPFAGKYWL